MMYVHNSQTVSLISKEIVRNRAYTDFIETTHRGYLFLLKGIEPTVVVYIFHSVTKQENIQLIANWPKHTFSRYFYIRIIRFIWIRTGRNWISIVQQNTVLPVWTMKKWNKQYFWKIFHLISTWYKFLLYSKPRIKNSDFFLDTMC